MSNKSGSTKLFYCQSKFSHKFCVKTFCYLIILWCFPHLVSEGWPHLLIMKFWTTILTSYYFFTQSSLKQSRTNQRKNTFLQASDCWGLPNPCQSLAAASQELNFILNDFGSGSLQTYPDFPKLPSLDNFTFQSMISFEICKKNKIDEILIDQKLGLSGHVTMLRTYLPIQLPCTK